MSATTRHIKGAEFPPELQKVFNIKPHQFLKVTVEVEAHNDEYDMENLGEALLESAKEIAEAKRQGRRLTNAREFLNIL